MTIIAMTALCRLIVLHSKEADPLVLVAEAGAIVLLAGAAYVMSMKDKLSPTEKAERRTKKKRIKLRQASCHWGKENEGETKVSKDFLSPSKDPQIQKKLEENFTFSN